MYGWESILCNVISFDILWCSWGLEQNYKKKVKKLKAESLLSCPIYVALPHAALHCFRFAKQFTLKHVTQTVKKQS